MIYIRNLTDIQNKDINLKITKNVDSNKNTIQLEWPKDLLVNPVDLVSFESSQYDHIRNCIQKLEHHNSKIEKRKEHQNTLSTSLNIVPNSTTEIRYNTAIHNTIVSNRAIDSITTIKPTDNNSSTTHAIIFIHTDDIKIRTNMFPVFELGPHNDFKGKYRFIYSVVLINKSKWTVWSKTPIISADIVDKHGILITSDTQYTLETIKKRDIKGNEYFKNAIVMIRRNHPSIHTL